MPTRPDARTLAAINAYQDASAAVRIRVDAFIRRYWAAMSDYRTGDIDRWAASAVPVVQGAQRTLASLTDAYLATLATMTLGRRIGPAGIPSNLVGVEALRGTPADEVYRRPGVTIWTALANGRPFTDARDAGLARARSIAATDLQLARTHAADHALKAHGAPRFRRTLTGAENCSLCASAASNTYRTGDLLPIHPGCDCGVEPIWSGDDPGQPPVPEPADDRGAPVVRHHGELGPLLVVKGQAFTGPDDI